MTKTEFLLLLGGFAFLSRKPRRANSSKAATRKANEDIRELVEQIEVQEATMQRIINNFPKLRSYVATSGSNESTKGPRIERLEKAVGRLQKSAQKSSALKEYSIPASKAQKKAQKLRAEILGLRPLQNLVKAEARKASASGLNQEDLEGVGYLGLYDAVIRYSPNSLRSFTNFAGDYVRKAIREEVNRMLLTVRLPERTIQELRNVRFAVNDFEQKGLPYTTQDIARKVGLREKRVKELLELGGTISIDTPLDEGVTIGSTLFDEETRAPTELAETSEDMDWILKQLKGLSAIQKRYIRMHFLEDMSFADIADEEFDSIENVRSIINKGLKVLKTKNIQLRGE